MLPAAVPRRVLLVKKHEDDAERVMRRELIGDHVKL